MKQAPAAAAEVDSAAEAAAADLAGAEEGAEVDTGVAEVGAGGIVVGVVGIAGEMVAAGKLCRDVLLN